MNEARPHTDQHDDRKSSNSQELSRLNFLIDGGCSCHISPPCNWCVSLTEDEVDAMSNSKDTLQNLLRNKRIALRESEEETTPTKHVYRTISSGLDHWQGECVTCGALDAQAVAP